MTGLRRLTVTMTEEEREALDRLARQDLRPAKSEIRWLITQEAQRRDLLDPPPWIFEPDATVIAMNDTYEDEDHDATNAV